MNNKILFLLALSTIITSCSNTNPKIEMENKEHGIILSNMDTTVSPKDDFYNFVNGNWDKKTTIPEDQVRWGGFGVLRKSTDKDVLEILDKAAKMHAQHPSKKRMANMVSKVATYNMPNVKAAQKKYCK